MTRMSLFQKGILTKKKKVRGKYKVNFFTWKLISNFCFKIFILFQKAEKRKIDCKKMCVHILHICFAFNYSTVISLILSITAPLTLPTTPKVTSGIIKHCCCFWWSSIPNRTSKLRLHFFSNNRVHLIYPSKNFHIYWNRTEYPCNWNPSYTFC